MARGRKTPKKLNTTAHQKTERSRMVCPLIVLRAQPTQQKGLEGRAVPPNDGWPCPPSIAPMPTASEPTWARPVRHRHRGRRHSMNCFRLTTRWLPTLRGFWQVSRRVFGSAWDSCMLPHFLAAGRRGDRRSTPSQSCMFGQCLKCERTAQLLHRAGLRGSSSRLTRSLWSVEIGRQSGCGTVGGAREVRIVGDGWPCGLLSA